MPHHRIAVAALLLVTQTLAAQQAEPRAEAGLFFSNGPGGSVYRATRLSADVAIDVTGIVARVSVAQRFRNESNDWVEGIYVFPLPDDAAVDQLVMQIGDRRIEGEIQEAEQARQTYDRARAAGQQASLVEQERPNLFTTSVANIAPGEEIAIEIGYLQTAEYDQGEFSLRLPMTLTPRFVPGAAVQPSTGPPIQPGVTAVPDATRITPPFLDPNGPIENLAALEVSVDAGAPLAVLESSSHATMTTSVGNRYTVRPVSNEIAMDRDFVVNWRFAPSQWPRAMAFTETVGGESHVLLMFLPPPTADLTDPTPRELIFIVDTSGSMGGTSIGQAKAALHWGIDRLTGIDRFNVIEFNSNALPLFESPVDLTIETREQAHRFVRRLNANGGTNMAPALAAALADSAAPGYLRQIVFITDGSVANEAGLFQMIRERLGDARLFTVGIGSAPNSHFMRKAAQFGRGSHLHISSPDEVEPAMRRLFDKIGRVALKEIGVGWPYAVESYPDRIPDLYHGEPVVVAARLARPITETFTVEAKGNAGPYAWTQAIAVEPGASPGVTSIWARRKIETLLDRRLESEPEDEIRTQVLEVALAHGMLSPYTSLVAVDRTPQRSQSAALRREALGNMLPAGSDINALFGRLPNTATSSRLLVLIGALTVLLLVPVLLWQRCASRRCAEGPAV
jgi:Ca-activated chloride channel family protein